MKNFNEIFRKHVAHHSIKSHKKAGFLSRKHIFEKITGWRSINLQPFFWLILFFVRCTLMHSFGKMELLKMGLPILFKCSFLTLGLVFNKVNIVKLPQNFLLNVVFHTCFFTLCYKGLYFTVNAFHIIQQISIICEIMYTWFKNEMVQMFI